MLKRILQVLTLVLAVGVLAPEAQTQELPTPFTIQGKWWCSDGGGKNVMKLEFLTIVDGTAPVVGGGVSRDFSQAFQVDEGEGPSEFAQFDSRRNLTAVIDLVSPYNGDPIGTLTITSGTLNSTKTKLKLRGTLALNDQPARNLRLRCQRIPSSQPNWEGRSTDARVRGQGVRSDKYDVQLTVSEELGFPCFDMLFGGPFRVDGIEMQNVLITGTVAVNWRGQFAADVYSQMLGNGFGRGKIRMPAFEGGRPVLVMKAYTGRPGPARIKSTLLELLN